MAEFQNPYFDPEQPKFGTPEENPSLDSVLDTVEIAARERQASDPQVEAADQIKAAIRPAVAPPAQNMLNTLRASSTTPGHLSGAAGKILNTFRARSSRPFANIKDASKTITSAAQDAGQAMDTIGEVEQKAAQNERAALDNYREKYTEQAEFEKAEERVRQEALRESEKRVRNLVSDVREMKIDPDRFMNEGSNRMLGSLAMALGEIGTTMAGGQNAAMKIIENKIDRDIAAQRDEISNKRAAIGDESNLLGMMRNRFGDERSAEAATRVAMRENLAMQLDGIAAESKSESAKANAALRKADLEKANAMDIAKINQSEVATAESMARTEGGLLGQKAQMAALEAKTGGAKRKMLPAGVLQKLGGLKTANKMLDELGGEWDSKTGWFSGIAQYLPATDASKYNDRRKVAAQVIGSILEGGKLTESDFGRYVDMLPTPGDSEERKKSKIQAIKSLLSKQRQGEAEALSAAGYDAAGMDIPDLKLLDASYD